MNKATLKHAAEILSLFEETPLEQIQALLESGLLADLRDSNIANIDRDEFRKSVELKPLVKKKAEQKIHMFMNGRSVLVES